MPFSADGTLKLLCARRRFFPEEHCAQVGNQGPHGWDIEASLRKGPVAPNCDDADPYNPCSRACMSTAKPHGLFLRPFLPRLSPPPRLPCYILIGRWVVLCWHLHAFYPARARRTAPLLAAGRVFSSLCIYLCFFVYVFLCICHTRFDFSA